ncbi:hypothetical protein Pelo_14086 [Pelomyxa schiedti]|nr:hypothetical protein Pelo_14086 [Pelomyxa schiedti]
MKGREELNDDLDDEAILAALADLDTEQDEEEQETPPPRRASTANNNACGSARRKKGRRGGGGPALLSDGCTTTEIPTLAGMCLTTLARGFASDFRRSWRSLPANLVQELLLEMDRQNTLSSSAVNSLLASGCIEHLCMSCYASVHWLYDSDVNRLLCGGMTTTPRRSQTANAPKKRHSRSSHYDSEEQPSSRVNSSHSFTQLTLLNGSHLMRPTICSSTLTYLDIGAPSETFNPVITCPSLVHLRFRGLQPRILYRQLNSLQNSCPSLQVLSLRDHPGLKHWNFSFPHLEHLDLGGTGVDDEAVQAVLRGCPELTEVDISHCPALFMDYSELSAQNHIHFII